ncbi:TldD protein, part of TldE/TldD proteolytic complex [Lachnospiraceae bacterium KM106-2]|nr:TldD protein, part of TldE/TldD proteolytic complex [Lachnospiraceae bacterium KM106-2]
MLQELVLTKKDLFVPGAHTELRAQKNTKRSVSIVSGNLTTNERTETSGISARVYKNGVYGFSSNPEYSDASTREVVKAATHNAEFMDQHIQKGNVPLSNVSNGKESLRHQIVDTDQKEYIDFMKEMDQYIANKYPALKSRGISLRSDSMEKVLSTSDGYDAHIAIPRSYIYVTLDSETNSGTPIELFKVFGGFGGFQDHFTDPALLYPEIDQLYEQVMQKREGIYAEAGYKTVVLGGIMSGMLAHEAVGHTVEADLVAAGSVASSYLGKRVGSDLVNLVDFAHTAFGKQAPLPVYVDDEGTKATDATLIKDGILVGYMNSRESAARYGMEPCGNARAFSFSDEPLIRMRNTAVLPGKDKLEDIIASVDDGYYLLNSTNGQADITGEFMFGVCMGYEIKHGKLGRALLDTTISGVAFDMLKTVDMVSDDMTWSSSGFCGKKQPMPVGMGGPAVRCKIMIGGR